ncbi:hypothetical protein VSY18_22775 [Bacillus albus]|uniref:hypothetical protein n=1 Tax=Bacillus TaxID=1386 RepID=UPI002001A498|nr:MULTISPECIES: hypothetical protein [Bacillus]MDA2025016.1 hypothetical protein [Bacillus cereus group sp. Bcc03]MDA2214761.1 hypothetical protein [Bacillus cereus group sp. Bc228]MDA2226717.1 hypothetical protein [Bacillus cereus group sp. Bc227]MDA2259088.1 hypothetical protein [Bacillus cereus group sp. Bc200]MDA2711345.1 hypothetical protein [Bacillus cereus group sp. Bc025]
MRYDPFFYQKLSSSLTMHFRDMGLNSEEYIVLNAYILYSQKHEVPNLNGISEVAGYDKEKVRSILYELNERKMISFMDNGKVDLDELEGNLHQIEYSLKSISERIWDSGHYNYGNKEHMGMVELIPVKEKGIKVSTYASDTTYRRVWDLEDMKKLANEILEYTERSSQETIDAENEELKKQYGRRLEQAKEHINKRQEEKRKRETPVAGHVILFRVFPSGLYKFTHTTKLSLEHKINSMKEQFGDNIEIIHSLETYDTSKFVHQFIKKQYWNRCVDGRFYNLTEEDIEFFRKEEYPPLTMDWLKGI